MTDQPEIPKPGEDAPTVIRPAATESAPQADVPARAIEDAPTVVSRTPIESGAQPAEAAPAEVVPAEAGPADVAPAEAVPADVVPAAPGPANVVPAEAAPTDVAPPDAAPADVASTGRPSADYAASASVDGASVLPIDRPEVAVGAAFAGGLLLALILRRFAH